MAPDSGENEPNDSSKTEKLSGTKPEKPTGSKKGINLGIAIMFEKTTYIIKQGSNRTPEIKEPRN